MIDSDSESFPVSLEMISDPPRHIYCRGDICLLNTRAVAIVGSRKCTDYGRWVAHTLAEQIAANGITVVSGMAEGIDSSAHEGALKAGGNTIAVLANGADICYPRSNSNLYAQIIRRGLIVSEYTDGTKAERYTFPQRNRIISGLCEVTVVVEAGLKSGSLITADFAANQGRDVFAVPGNMNRNNSFGCNKLISDGANILVSMDDILAHMGVDIKCTEQNYDQLSELERKVTSTIRSHSEITVDALSEIMNKPVSLMLGIITVLEMKGFVKTASGKIFIEK